MPESIKEPTVSVHGVPKSQFESQGASGAKPGGFDKKWILWIGLGIVGVIVLFMFMGGQQQSPNASNPTGGSGNASLDAELQQLQSEIDKLLADQNKSKPPPPKKKKKDGDINVTPDALHHVMDTHGFAAHQGWR